MIPVAGHDLHPLAVHQRIRLRQVVRTGHPAPGELVYRLAYAIPADESIHHTALAFRMIRQARHAAIVCQEEPAGIGPRRREITVADGRGTAVQSGIQPLLALRIEFAPRGVAENREALIGSDVTELRAITITLRIKGERETPGALHVTLEQECAARGGADAPVVIGHRQVVERVVKERAGPAHPECPAAELAHINAPLQQSRSHHRAQRGFGKPSTQVSGRNLGHRRCRVHGRITRPRGS